MKQIQAYQISILGFRFSVLNHSRAFCNFPYWHPFSLKELEYILKIIDSQPHIYLTQFSILGLRFSILNLKQALLNSSYRATIFPKNQKRNGHTLF